MVKNTDSEDNLPGIESTETHNFRWSIHGVNNYILEFGRKSMHVKCNSTWHAVNSQQMLAIIIH